MLSLYSRTAPHQHWLQVLLYQDYIYFTTDNSIMALYFSNTMHKQLCSVLKANLTFTLNYQALNRKLYHQKVKNVGRSSFINIDTGLHSPEKACGQFILSMQKKKRDVNNLTIYQFKCGDQSVCHRQFLGCNSCHLPMKEKGRMLI